MVRGTWVLSHVASYQRVLKWYLIPTYLTLSNIRYVSRVKWSNPGKGVAPSPTLRCSSYWKRSLLVGPLDYSCQLYFMYIYIYIYMSVCEGESFDSLHDDIWHRVVLYWRTKHKSKLMRSSTKIKKKCLILLYYFTWAPQALSHEINLA